MLKANSSTFALSAALLVWAFVPMSAAADARPGAHAGTVTDRPARGLPADPDVRSGMLPNGMRYSIRHNQRPPGSASLRLRIGAGSIHEAEDQRGLAHFLEHMVLNGTSNVPEGEFMRRLERHGLRFGPDTNASTGFTQTVYKLDLPTAAAETVDTALFLLREVADEATLAASAIDGERGIILSEERSRATPQFRILEDELAYTLRGQRVTQRMPIGLTEIIRNAPRERFAEFYDAYYRPERAVLIAVGDFDVDEMEAKIRAQFSSWRGEGEPGSDPDRGQVASRGLEARLFVEAGGPERISMAWVRPPDLRPDSRDVRAEGFAETLAVQILNRRLARIAATMSPPPFIAASLSRTAPARSGEIVSLSARIRPGEWRQALETIEREQRRLVEHGVTAEELEREIGGMRTALATSVSRAATRLSSNLANAMVDAIDGDRVFTAPGTNLSLFEEAVGGLTRARVQEAARGLLQGNGPLLYMTTANAVEGGEAALLAAYRDARARPVAPPESRQVTAWPYADFGPPGEVVRRDEINGLIGATAIRFANGVRLTVKPTDFTDDQVMVVVRVAGGRSSLPPGTPSPSWALGRGFITGGLRQIDFEDMREVLTSRAVGARASLFDNALVLHSETRPEDLDVQMQMFTAYIADPGWGPSGWDRLRSTSDVIHNRFEATPGGIYERDGAQLVHAGDRRWGTPTREEMAASRIDDVRALFAESFARAPIEVLIVGDVTVDEAIARTAATFGALPRRSEERPAMPPSVFPAPTSEPVRLTHAGRADQGLAMIAWPTMGVHGDTCTSRTLAVLASVFRLRLVDKVREEQGATYSPAASQVASPIYDDFGFLFGRIEAPPELLDRFLADAAAIAADLARAPVDADELERARRPMLEGLQRSRNSNIYWHFSLAGIQDDPRVAEAIRSQRSEYEGVTPESLREAARGFLRPETAWRLVIVPRGQ